MKSISPAGDIVLATLAFTVASLSAPAQDFGHSRDTSHSTIVGNIQLTSDMNRYPRSIQVSIDGPNYHQSTTATAGGIFMFTDVPGTDIVIEVRAPGFAITRTEFRAWTQLTDFSVPLGKALDRMGEPPPGSSTVNLRTLKVPQKAMNLAARAQEESDKNHLAQAVEWLQQAVQMYPEFVDAWNNLGATLLRMGKEPEAESAFLRALQTDPRSAPALRNLGLLYIETERPQEALSVLRKAREVRGENDLYIETYLGHALYGTGQFQEAEAVLKGAIKIKPDFPAALYPLALAQVQLHDYQHARDTFARFLQTSDKGSEAEAARSAIAKLDDILQRSEKGAAE